MEQTALQGPLGVIIRWTILYVQDSAVTVKNDARNYEQKIIETAEE